MGGRTPGGEPLACVAWAEPGGRPAPFGVAAHPRGEEGLDRSVRSYADDPFRAAAGLGEALRESGFRGVFVFEGAVRGGETLGLRFGVVSEGGVEIHGRNPVVAAESADARGEG